jgi:hypothetical protein
MNFNREQKTAIESLNQFLESKDDFFFLLTGPGGSGKTTIITQCLAGKSVAFTSFTNKAVRVLQKSSQKSDENTVYQTIHSLLSLEPITRNGSLEFLYSRRKLDLRKFDVIVFDECSTISTPLLTYIIDAWDCYAESHEVKKIKFIFTGDQWQLPPVKEKKCPVFVMAKMERWPSVKLRKIMRGKNDSILEVNRTMISFIRQMRKDGGDISYPYDMVPENKESIYAETIGDLYDAVVESVINGQDSIALAYSRKCCAEVNMEVLSRLDKINNIERDDPEDQIYLKGDRFCIDRSTKSLDGTKVHPGDIFEVLEEVSDRLPNPFGDKFPYLKQELDGQRLTARRISDGVILEFNYIFPTEILRERAKVRKAARLKEYKQAVLKAEEKYIQIVRGYCLTIYKSQGSEWEKVYVILTDLCDCLAAKDVWMLFKATYTAVSRASHTVMCLSE